MNLLIPPRPPMDGVLVIDKPPGPTSFEVVRRVRDLIGIKKVGHTGTLDPMATGVLPVCLGEATKLVAFLSGGDKSYDATFRLGAETDTYDAAGQVIAENDPPPLSAQLLESVLARFRGDILQEPPMFSAVKVAGKRLYQLAREGKEIPRRPRPVTVYELVLKDFTADELRISLKCSKGFFVRALAHDVGRALGCGAHLQVLRRTRSGPFAVEQSVSLVRLEQAPEDVYSHLISLTDALCELPLLKVSEAEAARVARGVPIEVPPLDGKVRVVSPHGRLLAIAETGSDQRLRYHRVLANRADVGLTL